MQENLLGHACTLVNMATWSYREGNCGMRTALHQSDSFIHRQPRHRSPVDAINSIPRVQTAMSWAVGCTLGHHETLAFPTHPQVRQLCESSKTLNHADCQRRVVTTEPAPAARRGAGAGGPPRILVLKEHAKKRDMSRSWKRGTDNPHDLILGGFAGTRMHTLMSWPP